MFKYLFSLLFILLTHCSIAPVIPIAIEDIVKKSENIPTEKITSTKLIEKPYEVDGKWFYPQEYSYLEEIGIAMRLDDLKTGANTKNGEIYHDEIMMGAHRSLPLPSIVRVTNLSNGYSVRVRVNHRGAFSNTNIINLSSGVFDKLNLNKEGDLVKITLIQQNETFIINEAYTYDEEKKVVEAPISSVTIGTIDESSVDPDNNEENNEVEISLDGFEILDDYQYNDVYLSVALFNFKENAQKIVDTISVKHHAKIIEHIDNDGAKKYMVVIGPFKNIDNLLRILNDDTIDKYEDLSIFII
jgi:rare lipoprotein A